MPDPNILPKRVRRCEVSDLVFAEEIAEIRQAIRALYETLLLLCRRIPASTLGADPVDTLMMPKWFENPKTGNVLPSPRGLDLSQPGLGAYNFRVNLLPPLELAAMHEAQDRIFDLLTKLRQREQDREKELKSKGLTK